MSALSEAPATAASPASPASPASAASAARLEFRACGRRVLRAPGDLAAHAERLGAALALPGAEPAQGALADLLHGCRTATLAQRHAALDAVRDRLHRSTVLRFEAVLGQPLPGASPLATRWSVLVQASLDVPRRALRCSSDDSRELAQAAVDAWQRDDRQAQDEFLEHCVICRDGLAFLLARRQLLRHAGQLPAHWDAVCRHLQNLSSSDREAMGRPFADTQAAAWPVERPA